VRLQLQSLLMSLAVSVQAAPSLETMKALDLPAVPQFKFLQAPAQEPKEPFFLDPNLAPLLRDKLLGQEVARVSLSGQLDRHRSLMRLKLGPRSWDVSVAGDAGFSNYYLTLRDGADLRFAPLGDVNRLRGEGIDITVQPGVVYNIKLQVNLFNPVRGSTLKFSAKSGGGASHSVKSGDVLDALKARSTVFSADGKEYWTLYGTDVDPATGGLANTRSFLFVHMDGLSSKAWPVAEGKLTVGQPYRVEMKSSLALTKSETELVVNKPR
jgi:hypothetical protein